MHNRNRNNRRRSGGGGNNRNSRGRGGNRNRGRGQSKDNSQQILRFIQSSQQKQPQEQETQVSRSFEQFSFHPQLKQNIDSLGFTHPTEIQDAAIDHIAEGKDILGIAHTGTGKTAAFLIPLVNKMLHDDSHQTVIIAPTRELAIQITSVFKDLTQNTNLYAVNLIGGSNIKRQIKYLQKKNHAIIGTPGRILDLIDRKKLSLAETNTFVLDEVDRMLDMGFVHDITKILKSVPNQKQSLYFSATMNQRVSGLISQFSKNVHQISVKQAGAANSVDQEIITYTSTNHKFTLLHDLLHSEDVTKSVIFGRTKHGVKRLMFQLRDEGFRTESIHGNKTQSQRKRALEAFRDSKVEILVATDVASRGIDVDDISHVINYDLPDNVDDYIHRIGRTGRAGKRGTAYTFVR